MGDKPQRKINEEELRALGFSESAIEEARNRERRGILDVEPSPDLCERIIAECRPVFEAEERKRSGNNVLYGIFYNVLDYVKSFYK